MAGSPPATIDAAKKNPNIKFIGVDQFQDATIPNLAGLIFDEDNWLTQILHNQAAMALQRRFHLRGMQMVILPMKLSV